MLKSLIFHFIKAIEKGLSDKRRKTDKLNIYGEKLIKELNEKLD